MAKDNYNDEFLKFIHDNEGNYSDLQSSTFFNINDSHNKNIESIKLKNITLPKIEFSNFSFNGCTFYNIVFESSFTSIQFTNCIFKNCEIYNGLIFGCNYIDCLFIDTIIDDIVFVNTNFSNTIFQQKADNHGKMKYAFILRNSSFEYCTFSDITFRDINFQSVSIFNTHIDAGKSLRIENGLLNICNFSMSNLSNSLFENCILDQTCFVACTLHNASFASNTINRSKNNCYIDLQTILKSELNKTTYSIFGIHNDEAKDFIKSMVTEIKFQSVFISYSFQDKEFARYFNERLRIYGVNTFLWERDAPGGKRLKHIMSENIQKHDRLLFIASHNSLKSEACHYELNEARERQNKEWKDIYYPIHIDDYLFTVSKDDIPRKFRDGFWENIEEVKEFHSKDFSMFKTEEDFKSPEFDDAVKALIKDLKL